jgi:SAM-dependent methyltransferase
MAKWIRRYASAFEAGMSTDDFQQFKEFQRKAWAGFVPFELLTTPVAARTVRHACVTAGQRVLDVACGTGVVAMTAARLGATVTGFDLTPELLARARENAAIGALSIDWHEGDAEALPFPDASFDVVVSQFGHMFAPRPAVVLAQMLRVLKPGGTLAFATWPPELFTGRIFQLTARYLPPFDPPPAPPHQWGDPAVILDRIGSAVRDVRFDRGCMLTPALTPAHHRAFSERAAGPVRRLTETLAATDPEKLAAYRREYDALAAEYFTDNQIRQDYLLTRATKR